RLMAAASLSTRITLQRWPMRWVILPQALSVKSVHPPPWWLIPRNWEPMPPFIRVSLTVPIGQGTYQCSLSGLARILMATGYWIPVRTVITIKYWMRALLGQHCGTPRSIFRLSETGTYSPMIQLVLQKESHLNAPI